MRTGTRTIGGKRGRKKNEKKIIKLKKNEFVDSITDGRFPETPIGSEKTV